MHLRKACRDNSGSPLADSPPQVTPTGNSMSGKPKTTFWADSEQFLSKKWIFSICLKNCDSTSSELQKHLAMSPKLVFYGEKLISDLWRAYRVEITKSRKSMFLAVFFLIKTVQNEVLSIPYSQGLLVQCLGSNMLQPWPQCIFGKLVETIRGAH